MAQAPDPIDPTRHRKLTFAHYGGHRQLSPMELIHRAASQAHGERRQSVLDQLRQAAAQQLAGHNKAPNAFDQGHNRFANGLQPHPGLGGDINRPPGQPQLHVPISEGGGFGNFPTSGSSGVPVSPPIPNPGIHGFGPGGGVMTPSPGTSGGGNPVQSNDGSLLALLQRRQELNQFGNRLMNKEPGPLSPSMIHLGGGLFLHPETGQLHGPAYNPLENALNAGAGQPAPVGVRPGPMLPPTLGR